MRTHLAGRPLALLCLLFAAGVPLMSGAGAASAGRLAPVQDPEPPDEPEETEDPAAGDAFEALEAEYESAEDEHRRELRRLRGDERDALARRHPAIAFWPRFQRLSDDGDGRALFWMARSARDRYASLDEGREATRKLYDELLRTSTGQAWFGEVVERLPAERVVLGADVVVDALRRVIVEHPDRNVQARAMVLLAAELKRSKDPAERAEAQELLRAVTDEYADTEAGAALAEELRLEVGGLAPNFTGKTVDGYEFELADYRGKVVLVDFYGFW